MPREWQSNSALAPGPATTDAPPLVRPPQLAPHDPARPSFPFDKLCRVMNAIRETQGNDKKRDKLERLFASYRQHVGLDLFPMIRLLIPERDRERSVFQLKEQKLAKAYNVVLGIDSKTNEDAYRLEHWKQPLPGKYGVTPHNEGAVGDFPMVLYSILRVKSTGKDVYTIEQVNNKLDELAAVKGDQKAVVRVLKDFERNLSPDSQSWLVRVILKDMKLTLKEKSILDVVHPDAMRLFIVCSDLKRVCWTLWDHGVRLDKEDTATQLNIFSPFQPMYANRNNGDIPHAVKAIGGPFMIEEKLDGERIQLHKKGDKFQYWSRQGKDYTSLYGRDRAAGALTPFIADAFRDDIQDCILDGEMLAYDPALQRYLPFGTLKTTALAERTSNPDEPNVIYMVFDIVYIRQKTAARGMSLASDKRCHLSQRKRLLEGITTPAGVFSPGVIRKVDHRLEFPYRRENCTKPEEVKEELDSILRRRGEGLILKKNTAPYTPSGRSDLWIKIKPEYFDELGENADLLVLGGWWGQGHRGGKLGGFLLGVKVEGEVDKDGGPVYSTVCKVGTGLNLRDYNWIRDNHQLHFHPFDKKDPSKWPTCMKFADKTLEDKPDVWIHPRDSFVIEVKAAEIIESTDFAMGQTLRFPRAKFLRYDLLTQQKMAARGSTNVSLEEPAHFTTEDWLGLHTKSHEVRVDGSMSGKRRQGVVPRKKQKVLPAFEGIKSKDVEVKSGIFDGTTAYFLTGSDRVDKKELMRLFVENGGKVKSSYTKTKDGTVLAVISKKLMASTNTLVKAGNIDILTPEWVLDSIKAKKELAHFKKYLLFATEDTKASRAYGAVPDEYDSEAETDSEDELPHKVVPTHNYRALLSPEVGGNEKSDDSASSHTEAEIESSSETEIDGEVARIAPTENQNALSKQPSNEDGLMGDGSAMPDKLFAAGASGERYLEHMVFFFDTLELWETNNLSELDVEQEVSDELAGFESRVVAHGGKVTKDLHDPTLTHVVTCSSDSDRYSELQDETMVKEGFRLKLRHIVAVSWLKRTFEEASPQPESKHLA